MNLYFRVCWGWDYLPNFHRLCQAVLILEFDSVAVTPENHRQQFTLVGLRMYAAMRTDAGPAVLTCRLDACVHMHVYTCPNPVHSIIHHTCRQWRRWWPSVMRPHGIAGVCIGVPQFPNTKRSKCSRFTPALRRCCISCRATVMAPA